MGDGYRMLGFVVIAILYIGIGIMAAMGTINVLRKMFSPKSEQILYAISLILIAALYLAFAAYFEASAAWSLEGKVVVAFFAIGLLGVRLPFALIIGFALHGLWDLVHELEADGGYSAFALGQLTAIPLAYGFFCSAFDFYVAAHFYRRRVEWSAAWKALSR